MSESHALSLGSIDVQVTACPSVSQVVAQGPAAEEDSQASGGLQDRAADVGSRPVSLMRNDTVN